MSAEPGLGAEVFARLHAIDTNGFIDAGRVYGGGLYKMEPKELATIPAPALGELLEAQPFRLVAGW